MNITKQQYEYALRRIEDLLPIVDDEMPTTDDRVVELTMVSDIVEAYEKEHYPIAKPTVGDIIRLAAEEKGMTQRQLAAKVGVSPSRINDFICGRAEPNKYAWLLEGRVCLNSARIFFRINSSFIGFSIQLCEDKTNP